MAFRFLLKESYSQLSRSGALFQVSAPVAAAAPAARHVLEAGVSMIGNGFRGVICRSLPICNNNGLHGLAARYLNTSPCLRDAVRISCPRTCAASISISQYMKAVHQAGRARQTFSSKTTPIERIEASGDDFRRRMRITSYSFVVLGIVYPGTVLYMKSERFCNRNRSGSEP